MSQTQAALSQATSQSDVSSAVLRVVGDVDKEVRLRTFVDKAGARLRDLMKAQACALWLIDRPAKQLRSVLLPADHLGPPNTAQASASDVMAPLHLGVGGHVARSGELVLISKDAHRHSLFHRDVDGGGLSGFVAQSLLCGPLRDARGEVVAVLHLYNSTAAGDGFGERELSLFRALSGPLTAGLARCLQYEATYRAWKEGAAKATQDVKRATEGMGERDRHIRQLEAELTGTQKALKDAQVTCDRFIERCSKATRRRTSQTGLDAPAGPLYLDVTWFG